MAGVRRDVRYVPPFDGVGEGTWQMRCDSCASAGQTTCWWDLTIDLWNPRSGLARCRACHNLTRRLRRRQTPDERRARQRAYYHAHRDHRLAWRHAYHAAHKAEINARRRAEYAARKAASAMRSGLWSLDGPVEP